MKVTMNRLSFAGKTFFAKHNLDFPSTWISSTCTSSTCKWPSVINRKQMYRYIKCALFFSHLISAMVLLSAIHRMRCESCLVSVRLCKYRIIVLLIMMEGTQHYSSNICELHMADKPSDMTAIVSLPCNVVAFGLQPLSSYGWAHQTARVIQVITKVYSLTVLI